MPLSDLSLKLVVLVAVGGALGAVARYLVSGLTHTGSFPWGTFWVNFTGSVLLALFMFGGVLKGHVGPDVRLVVGVGILGAYTTMSTFTFETVTLLERGAFRAVAFNILLNPVVCLAGAWVGSLVGRLVPGPLGT